MMTAPGAQMSASGMSNGAVPILVQKWPVYHSSKVQNCTWWFFDLSCDPTNVWLNG